MITVNWPFFVSLIIIVSILPLKVVEGRIFEGRSFKGPLLRRIRVKNTPLGLFLKKTFARDKDLKRPFYVMIPFAFFMMSYQMAPLLLGWDRGSWPLSFIIISAVIFITLVIFFDAILMVVANKEVFRDKERKRVYLRSQLVQFATALVIFSIISGAGYLHFSKPDPGWVKESVEWALEPEYSASFPAFSEGLVPVKEWGKFGYMDKEGRMVIEPKYKYAYGFSQGLAAVEYKGKWGYIDKTGREVIPFIYESIVSFDDDITPVKKDGIWCVINKEGEVLFETDFQLIGPYNEGVAKVEIADEAYPKTTRENLIDEEGRLLFTKEYDFLGHFSEGCIPAQEKGSLRTYYLDKNEEKVMERGYVMAEGFSNGVAEVVLNHAGETAFIDREGTIFLKTPDEFAYGFSEGLVRFQKGDRKGFKDLYGNVIIPANFKWVMYSSEGMIGLWVNGKWGFVKNPLPIEIQEDSMAFWKGDGLIGNIEGLPLYAKEVENQVEKIQAKTPEIELKIAYQQAFEVIKKEKALEKYGKEMPTEEIQFQLGHHFYKKMLLGLPD